jgi:hypothetical protein
VGSNGLLTCQSRIHHGGFAWRSGYPETLHLTFGGTTS